MALVKQMGSFYIIDSRARSFAGMPDDNGAAIIMKFSSIIDLDQYLLSLAVSLHTSVFDWYQFSSHQQWLTESSQ